MELRLFNLLDRPILLFNEELLSLLSFIVLLALRKLFLNSDEFLLLLLLDVIVEALIVYETLQIPLLFA